MIAQTSLYTGGTAAIASPFFFRPRRRFLFSKTSTKFRKGLNELARQFRFDRNVQLSAHHDGVRYGLCAWMVIEEDVGALNVFVFENGFQTNGVGFEFFRRVQVVVSFVPMFVTPPLAELTAMKPYVQQPSAGDFKILPDGIFELGFVDERRSGLECLKDRHRFSPGTMTQFDGLGEFRERLQQHLQPIDRLPGLLEAGWELEQDAAKLVRLGERLDACLEFLNLTPGPSGFIVRELLPCLDGELKIRRSSLCPAFGRFRTARTVERRIDFNRVEVTRIKLKLVGFFQRIKNAGPRTGPR